MIFLLKTDICLSQRPLSSGPEVIFDSDFSFNKYLFSYQALGKSILGCSKGFLQNLILTGDLWWVALSCWTSLHDLSLKHSGLGNLCECPTQLTKCFGLCSQRAAWKSHVGCDNLPSPCHSPLSDIISSACGMSPPPFLTFLIQFCFSPEWEWDGNVTTHSLEWWRD